MFEMCCNLHGLKYLQVYYKYREEGECFLEEFWRIFEANLKDLQSVVCNLLTPSVVLVPVRRLEVSHWPS